MTALGRLDPVTVLLWFALLTFGWVMIGSATMVGLPSAPFGNMFTHGAYLAVSMAGFLLALLVPLQWLQHLHRVALLIALVLCVVVLLPGIGHSVNGAQRWIKLGSFTLQASEFAKPLLLLYLAGYLSRPAPKALGRSKHGKAERAQANLVKLLPAALAVTSLGALLLLQPDFGATVVLAVMTIGMLFVAGTRLGYFILLVLAAAAVLALLIVVQPYRWNRLVAFSDPWSHAFGGGYQLTQALIGFGRGDWFGLGLGEGVQKLFYLPEAHNDFILAVIAEELGIVGVLAVLALLLIVVYRALASGRRALTAGLPFAGYLCYGVGLLLGVQVLFNAGVNTGILPTKGLTLPFISYGGNSLMVCCALIGLLARADIEVAMAAEPKRRKRGHS